MDLAVVTKKTDYKLKNVHFMRGNLLNEDGEVVDLNYTLELIFGKEPFTISASNVDKVEYDMNYFEQHKDDEEE